MIFKEQTSKSRRLTVSGAAKHSSLPLEDFPIIAIGVSPKLSGEFPAAHRKCAAMGHLLMSQIDSRDNGKLI